MLSYWGSGIGAKIDFKDSCYISLDEYFKYK